MSLRNYLFTLVGVLIITLTLSQLFLVNWINQQLNTEVEQQAQKLSHQLVELAVEEFVVSPDDKPTTIKHLRKINRNNENTDIQIITTDGNKAIKHKITKPQQAGDITVDIDSESLKKELHTIVKRLHRDSKTIINADATIIVKEGSPFTKQNVQWFSSADTHANQSRNKLVNFIQWSIIGSALLALTIAFWLSTKFNRPLKQLSQGFNELAKGNYHHQVTPSGVNEIRQTICQFNEMVAHLHQLTEQQKHHKEISHLAELGEVSRGLAHTLRNPIHTIGLSVEQLQDEQLSPEKKQALANTIKSKITHIDRHIKALLTLTTSSIKRDTNVPIYAVIQDIVLEHKFSPNNKLAFKLDIDKTLMVKGAESEIRSILHTLITNACEASHAQGEVTIIAKANNSYIGIEVIDQGEGLTEDIAKKLFQPHVSSKPEGAGMGLYIAKRLLTLHYDGTISLTNRQDKNTSGCCAHITLKDAHE